MNLADIRAQYPQYSDWSDEQLTDALHQTYYSDLDRDTFNQRIGYKPEVGFGDAAWRGVKKAGSDFVSSVAMPMVAAPAVIGDALRTGPSQDTRDYFSQLRTLDNLAERVTDPDQSAEVAQRRAALVAKRQQTGFTPAEPVTTAQDWVFENVIDPIVGYGNEQMLDPNKETASLADELAFAGGYVGGTLPQLIAGGALGAGRASQVMGGAAAYAAPQTITRTRELAEKGVDQQTLGEVAAANFPIHMAEGVLPVSMPGRIATRALTGAAINAPIGMAQRAIEGEILGEDNKKLAQNPLDPKAILMDSLLGAGFGAAMGRRAASQTTDQAAPMSPDLQTALEGTLAQQGGAGEGPIIDIQPQNIDQLTPAQYDGGIDYVPPNMGDFQPEPPQTRPFRNDAGIDYQPTPVQSPSSQWTTSPGAGENRPPGGIDYRPVSPDPMRAQIESPAERDRFMDRQGRVESIQERLGQSGDRSNVADPRLKRLEYRDGLKELVNEMATDGRSMAIVDESGIVTGRTGSQQVHWAQGSGVTRKQAQVVVDKALAGQPLGQKQTEVLGWLLDTLQSRRYGDDGFDPRAPEDIRAETMDDVRNQRDIARIDRQIGPTPPEIPDIEPVGLDDGSGSRFRLGGQAQDAPTESVRRIQEAIAPAQADVGARVQVDVVDSVAELPFEAPADAQAAFNPADGRVYLVASNLRSPEEAQAKFAHEVVGHYGVRGLLGERLDPILDEVFNQYRAGKLGDALPLDDLAARYELDLNNPEHRRIAAEEYLAHAAETGVNPSLVNRVAVQLRNLLRRMFPNLSMSPSEVRQLISDARRYVRRGGGETPAYAQRDARFAIGGRNSRTADRAALERAEAMEMQGKSREDIYRDTGWYRGTDTQWRYEIPDEQSRWRGDTQDRMRPIIGEEGVRGAQLRELYDHPEFFDAYPALGDRMVREGELGASLGRAGAEGITLNRNRAGIGSEKGREVLLHEMQHTVQDREGFARGGSVQGEMVRNAGTLATAERNIDELSLSISQLEQWQRDGLVLADVLAEPKLIEDIQSRAQSWERDLGVKVDPFRALQRMISTPEKGGLSEFKDLADLKAEQAALIDEKNDAARYQNEPEAAYWNLAGEVEARNVQNRRDLGEDMRRDLPPFESEDVPTDDQRVRFSRGGEESRDPRLRADNETLIAQHNLSEKNLLHADKMGGLPVPSLGVTQFDMPLGDKYGDITLLGPPDMVDPRSSGKPKVYGADVYSPRYPSVEYQMDRSIYKALDERFGESEKAVGETSGFEASEIERRGLDELQNNTAVMHRFLTEEGIPPDVAYRGAVSESAGAFIERHLSRWVNRSVGPDEPMLKMNPDFREDVRKGFLKEYDGTPAAELADWARKPIDFRDPHTSQIIITWAQSVERLRREGNQQKPDPYRSRTNLRSQIDDLGLKERFHDWTEQVWRELAPNERLFGGFTPSGNRRYKPHTLENVVKAMKKNIRGGENFNYGLGSLRAHVTPQFKTLGSVKANKKRLVNKDAMERYKVDMDRDFESLADVLSNYSSRSNDFGFLDTVSSVLEESTKLGIPRALREYGFEDVPEMVQLRMRDFMKELESLPTEYFEAVLPRAVDIGEFNTAVVPKELGPRARQVLEQKGVRIVEYADDADRKAKIAQESEQQNLRFSRAGEATGEQRARDMAGIAGAYQRRIAKPVWDRLSRYSHAAFSKVYLADDTPKEFKRMVREYRAKQTIAAEKVEAVAKSGRSMPEGLRNQISDYIEGEMAAGVVPPKVVVDTATMMQAAHKEQGQKLVELGMLEPESHERLSGAGKYLARYYTKHLLNNPFDRAIRTTMRQGIQGDRLRGRGLFEEINAKDWPKYKELGWQLRGTDEADIKAGQNESIQVWRDWTKAEREKMGEVRDAVYRYTRGYMEAQRDIAMGEMFQRMADEGFARDTQQGEGWVQVPDTRVPGTGVRRYGKIAGKWVEQAVWDELKIIRPDDPESARQKVLGVYLKGLSLWKEGKTALNPVVHGNNIVSNVIMADLAGISPVNVRAYRRAAQQYLKKDKYYKEAQEAGLFGTEFYGQEVRQILPELEKFSNVETAASGWMTKFMSIAYRYSGAKGYRNLMGRLYAAEDEYFKMLAYIDQREKGADPQSAVDEAERWFFNYADVPQGVRVIKNTYSPFFSYTYKALPALLYAAVHTPWRFAKWWALFGGANWAAYESLFGDGADQREEEERALMPEHMRGYTLFPGVPKSMRLPVNSINDNPMFLDLSRRMPLGDLFDAHNQAGGASVWAPFMPSGPILSMYAGVFLDKDPFFGKEVVKPWDKGREAEVRAQWVARQLLPNTPVLPGSYSFNKVMNGIAGTTGEGIDAGPLGEFTGEDYAGRKQNLSRALADTLTGTKIREVDLDLSRRFQVGDLKRDLNAIRGKIRSIQRDNRIGPKTKEKEIERLQKLLDQNSKAQSAVPVP